MKLRIYNKTLDPNIWNEDKTLKPDIREHLLKIAEDFYNSTDLQGEIHNILFLGSSANYNWTPTSDVDLHIVIDIAEEKINEEYARKFMDSLGSKWNTEHDIEIKGHPVEVYIQDVREPNSDASLSRPGAAIYSLFDGKWIQEPTHEKLDIDADKIRRKFQTIQEKVKKLVETGDIDKLKELMKSIRNYRNTGLANGGEFCTENLVFKALRKSGVLEKIKTTINTVYDKQVSLPEHGNMQPSTDTSPLNESMKRPYIVVGSVDNDLNVHGITDYENKYGHTTLPAYRSFHVRFRYNSKYNTLYLDTDNVDTEKQKDAILDYLNKKYGVVNPKIDRSLDYYDKGHDIDLQETN
jgi:predicted nucleotidyltransferase